LVGGEWDQRGWSEATSIRQALFELACDVAIRADELPPLLAPL